MSFVHLHTHSHYSLLEASSSIEALAKKAAEFQMPALALTDVSNMFGAIEFYFACEKAGVKPILGLELRLPESPETPLQNPSIFGKVVLLATSHKGYQNLCALSTQSYANKVNLNLDVPFIDWDSLKNHQEDLILLTGGHEGWLYYLYNQKGDEKAKLGIQGLQNIFGDRLYLEANRQGLTYEPTFHQFLAQASKELSLKVVAANNVHYLLQEDQIAQEVLVCVGTNKTLRDETRYRLGTDQFYFKSSEQMQTLFAAYPEWVANTLEVASRCNLKLKTKDENGNPIYHLPTYPTEGGRDLKDELQVVAQKGLEERFEELKARNELNEEEKPKYYERLEFELNVINQMGFNGYFLIVQDFIGWAKKNNIPVGPGRGSGAGSLVAYSLKITDLDPLRYSLIFERFLNPERISMPDFDIDFCQDRRPEVIQYVTEKYGPQSVSQIITYGKLQTRAAMRDVGRVLGFSFTEVNHICKLVPEKLGITISEALEAEPQFAELMEQDPQVQTLIDLALKIEGLVRHAGIHAAGVIIADGKIVDHAPLYIGSDGENVVQYDMKHAEKIGLIKFDFLGLKTLTHIQKAFDLIQSNRGKTITHSQISMSDPGIYELMQKGDTAGVFQFEGAGITSLIVKAKPNRFEDLVAITALYRPGPMDMIPDYLKRKHGETPVKYIFPELETILQETYGIVVYQEQVQLVASKIANYSLGEADMLRRAMGKKIASEMEMQKERFLKGAKENQYDEKKANELFDMMAEFAKYGFNKSHAAAYCVITAQTAWLKHYYPVEFYAALLSTEMNNTDNVVKYSKDAAKKGIKILPPSVNMSDFLFTVNGDDIIFSLGAIKGVGGAAVESILQARSEQPEQKFETLDDFFASVDLRKVNKKTIESLIKAGAFDEFGYNRRELLDGYPLFIESQERQRKDKELGQFDLFASMDNDEGAQKVVIPNKSPDNPRSILNDEKEVLGFYLSGHPLDGMDHFFKTKTLIDPKTNKEITEWMGMITDKREIITKKGTRMAFLQVEDQSENFEAIVFPDAYDKFKMDMPLDVPLMFQGRLEIEENQKKFFVSSVQSIVGELSKKNKLVISTKDQELIKVLPELESLAGSHPGRTQLYLDVEISDVNRKVLMKVSGEEGVYPEVEFLQKLNKLFPIHNIYFDQ